MDRNLWATTIRNEWDSTLNSFWYKYQWWNNYWFLDETTVKAQNEWLQWDESFNHSWYISKKFINWNNHDHDVWNGDNANTSNNTEHHNWIWWWENDKSNNRRWAKLTNYSERQWPCPNGRHVPSAWEWWLLIIYWSETKDNEGNKNANWQWQDWLFNLKSNYRNFQKKFKIPFAWYRNYKVREYNDSDQNEVYGHHLHSERIVQNMLAVLH